MAKYRFNKDWKDEVYKGQGKTKRLASYTAYSAGVRYALDADTLARAQKAGVIGPVETPRTALDIPEADIRKMKKDEIVDFFLDGGRAVQSAALQAENDALKSEIITLKGEAQALIDSWNDGAGENEAVTALSEVTDMIRTAQDSDQGGASDDGAEPGSDDGTVSA